MNYDYNKRPGQVLKNEGFKKQKSVISIIFPVTVDNEINRQSIISILNQTYPNFELLIIGNKKFQIKDERIKYFHQQGNNILASYNYGITKCSKDTSYYLFFKEGNLLETTYLETVYWSLITHEEASIGYTNSVIYGENDNKNKLLNEFYEPSKANINPIFMIKKESFDKLNDFDEKYDYSNGLLSFFQKFVQNGMVPIHSSWYLSWISYDNYIEFYNAKAHMKKLKNIKNTVKTIIQFPYFKYNYEQIDRTPISLVTPNKTKNEKINILMIVPWIIIGGADIFNLELIRRLDKEKFSVTLVSTEPSVNNLRQQFESICDVYDITSFLEAKDYLSFINYLIAKNNINLIFNTSSLYGYSILPYLKAKYPDIPIVDYIHMEEWYNRNGGYSRSSTMVESIIDQTWVCNSVTEKIMVDYFKRKKDEVKTVYIGVDTDKFDPNKKNRESLLKKYNLPSNKTIVGYICRISEQKRPLLLANIIDKTLSQRNDIFFLIVGDGSMKGVLKERVAKYKNNVKFLPSTSDTPSMYALCDITINCSIKEGLALTAYESLSMGVPVISADVGGQRELVGDDVGKLVKCYQEEKDILDFSYTKEEIDEYVQALDEVIPKLDILKKNCRKKILNKFTLDQMGENMSKEFIRVYNNPNKDKIEIGKSLYKSIGIAKELIIASLMEDSNKTVYQSDMLLDKFYNKTMRDMEQKNNNKPNKAEKMREILWKFGFWRKFTQSKMWKKIKKVLGR